MEKMFYGNRNLKYLDLSNFDTSNVNTINYMFYGCSSLIYLNLKSFKLKDTVDKKLPFYSIYSSVKYCIADKKTKNLLRIFSDCSIDCFKENIKIDIKQKKCINSCLKNGYKYEYKNICFNECPKDTYYKFSDRSFSDIYSLECFDEAPQGFYLDSYNKVYKNCYENCKFCFGEGNKANNNCKECITNFTFLNYFIGNKNCYKKCEYYYYFDEQNEYHCTSSYKCPNNYNKLIVDQNRCIDKCKNDNIYKYEYNDQCFISCLKDTYLLMREGEYFCFNNTPEGYYLDIEQKMYKKCYYTCRECYGEGNETFHNCLECKSNYTFFNNSMNIMNCYEKCQFYHYFDETNKFYCTDNNTCPKNYKLIIEKNKCIDNCRNDDIYKYEYNNKCLKSYINGSDLYQNNTDNNITSYKIDEYIYKYNNICYNECHLDTHSLIENGTLSKEEKYINYYNNTKGYYLDKNDFIYKKCYYTCETCEAKGDHINHNCLTCNTNYNYSIITNNYINCYINCPKEYPILIEEKMKCVGYKVKNMLKNIIKNESVGESEIIYYNKIIYNIEKVLISDNYDTLYIDKGYDEIIEIDKMIVTLTTPKNQMKNLNNNMTTISIDKCENILKEYYNISYNDSLYIMKMDFKQEEFNISKIEFEIYSKLSGNNLVKLNKSLCNDCSIFFLVPIIITGNIDKLNSSSGYFKDICYTATSDSGTDITLLDRRKELINSNQITCQENCEFSEYNYISHKANCSCKVKESSSLSFDYIHINKTKLFENFANFKNTESLFNLFNIIF